MSRAGLIKHGWILWCLAAIAAQVIGALALRGVCLDGFGARPITPPDQVTAVAMTWITAVGVVGLITALGAGWSLLRRAPPVAAALGMIGVATPALLLSGLCCLVGAVSLGW